MSEHERDILEQVASGAITPEEGAQRLRTLDPQPEPERSGEFADAPVRAVRVNGSFRTARIVGDPSIAGATVDGEHVIERDGDTLVISAEDHIEGEVDRQHAASFRRKGGRVVIGMGSTPLPLEVRMNPHLALHVELAAGTVKIDQVTGPISAQVSAGALKIKGFASPLDIEVAGGAVAAEGLLDHGDSSIRCAAGAVKVKLSKGSSVTVTAHAGLGKVALPGQRGGTFLDSTSEAVIGGGEATLNIDASMGAVTVTEG